MMTQSSTTPPLGSGPVYALRLAGVARVGILTGGGDCPGLNAVIRAVARRSLDRGWEVVGVREGWRGLVEGISSRSGSREVSGILPRGGTILGTSRTNPYKVDGGVERCSRRSSARARRARRDRRRGHARRRGAAPRGARLPGRRRPEDDRQRPHRAPTTPSASTRRSSIATEAIDRLHTTAESHNRVMVVEVMGRHTGWIARHERDRRRRRRDPDPRAADHGRGRLQPAREAARSAARTSRSSSSARATSYVRVRRAHARRRRGARDRPVRPRRPRRRRRRSSRARSRSAPASRRGSRCSATSSAAAPRRRATACSRRATGSRRPISSTRAASAGWPRCTATRSSTSRSRRRPTELKTVPPEWYDGRAGLLRLG